MSLEMTVFVPMKYRSSGITITNVKQICNGLH
jgi:hypothetical protein